MRKLFLFFIILCHSSLYALDSQDVSTFLSDSQKTSTLAQRMDLYSSIFLKARYIGGPLGEGTQGRFDNDELYRFDAFDCTTYVETVLALSLSDTLEDFSDWMNRIRYKNAEVSYVTRNHFVSVDWINNNDYLLRDVTAEIAKEKTLYARSVIDKKAWYQGKKITEINLDLPLKDKEQRLDEFKNLGNHFSPVKTNFPYISIKELLKTKKLFNQLESGFIVNIVRPNWNLKPTDLNVSHQGILIKNKAGELVFRHASSVGKNPTVREENFRKYLEKYQDHKTIKGINLLEPFW